MTTPLQEAVAAIRAGKKPEARRLLAQIVTAERTNVQAWFLLSHVVETKEQKGDCLRRVLSLQPTHEQAQKLLTTLSISSSSPAEKQIEARQDAQVVKQTNTSQSPLQHVTKATASINSKSTTDSDEITSSATEANRGEPVRLKEGNTLPSTPLFAQFDNENPLGYLPQKPGEEGAVRLTQGQKKLLNKALYRAGYKYKRKAGGEYTEWVSRDSTYHVYHRQDNRRIVLISSADEVSPPETIADLSPAEIKTTSSGTIRSGKPGEHSSEAPGRLDFTASEPKRWLDDKTLIDALDLSRRAYNALRRAGITTIEQLATLEPEYILGINNIGEKTFKEIEAQLSAYLAHSPLPTSSQPLAKQSKFTSGQAVASQTNEPTASIDIPKDLDERQRKFLPLSQDRTPVEALSLSRRAFNALIRAGIPTIGDLASLSRDQLLELENIGGVTVSEIEAKLRIHFIESANPFRHEKTPNENPLLPTIDPELLNQVVAIPLDQISIERLGLPETMNRRLYRQEVQFIVQLLQQPKILDANKKIVDALNCYMRWMVEQDEAVWNDEIAGKGISPLHQLTLANTSLEELTNQWLSVLRERGQKVIRWRYGLNGESLTLQEIGERLGLTRERVRQLEKRALKILQNRYNGQIRDVMQPLIALLRHKLAENGGLLSHLEISSWIETENSIRLGNINPLEAISLICQMDTQFHCLPKLEIIALNLYSVDSIVAIQVAFASILREKLTPTSSEELFEEFRHIDLHEMLQDWPEVYPDDFILACLRVHPEIEQLDSGLYTPAKWSKKRLGAIIEAMREIGKPAHYSVITQKANSLLPPNQHFTVRAVHARLGQYPQIFVWVRLKGTYGLKEWGLEQGLSYAEGLAQILEDTGYPLTLDQIMTRLPAVRQYFDESSVVLTLSTHERFCSLPNNTYGLAEWTDKLSHNDFGDLFGNQLARWQIEFDKQSGRGEISTQNEVDAIRSIGLDFFAD